MDINYEPINFTASKRLELCKQQRDKYLHAYYRMKRINEDLKASNKLLYQEKEKLKSRINYIKLELEDY